MALTVAERAWEEERGVQEQVRKGEEQFGMAVSWDWMEGSRSTKDETV